MSSTTLCHVYEALRPIIKLVLFMTPWAHIMCNMKTPEATQSLRKPLNNASVRRPHKSCKEAIISCKRQEGYAISEFRKQVTLILAIAGRIPIIHVSETHDRLLHEAASSS